MHLKYLYRNKKKSNPAFALWTELENRRTQESKTENLTCTSKKSRIQLIPFEQKHAGTKKNKPNHGELEKIMSWRCGAVRCGVADRRK
jgi:hypothetical protein